MRQAGPGHRRGRRDAVSVATRSSAAPATGAAGAAAAFAARIMTVLVDERDAVRHRVLLGCPRPGVHPDGRSILASGSTLSPGLPTAEARPWRTRGDHSPVTVAGPRRIHTDFLHCRQAANAATPPRRRSTPTQPPPGRHSPSSFADCRRRRPAPDNAPSQCGTAFALLINTRQAQGVTGAYRYAEQRLSRTYSGLRRPPGGALVRGPLAEDGRTRQQCPRSISEVDRHDRRAVSPPGGSGLTPPRRSRPGGAPGRRRRRRRRTRQCDDRRREEPRARQRDPDGAGADESQRAWRSGWARLQARIRSG